MATTSKKPTTGTATTVAKKKPPAKKSVAVATPAVKKSATASKPVGKKTAAAPAKKVSATQTVIATPPTVVKKAAPKAVKAVSKKVGQLLSTSVIPLDKPAVARKRVIKTAVSPEERYHMITTAAYYLAERRGFCGGYEMHDWISAEADIDAMLKAKG